MWADNAEKRSNEFWQASKEGADFLRLGEPIKVGHHSENRHRALIERNHNRMGKCVEEGKKAEEYEQRAEYWKGKENEINLSMPESIEFYEHKLEQARAKHKELKDNPEKRSHGMSLQYANKEVKTAEDNYKNAVRLWGDEEQREAMKEQPKAEKPKKETFSAFTERIGGFFAFSNTQFDEQKKEGIEYVNVGQGLVIPKDKVEELKQFLK